MSQFAILPAAFTMIAGPQIISAVVLTTSRDPRRNSLAYIAGVATAVLLGVAVTFAAASLASDAVARAGGSDAVKWIDYAFVALLAAAAIRALVTRKTAEPPSWLTALQEAEAGRAYRIGLLLFLLMPSDIMVMLSVGRYLVKNGLGYLNAIPFITLTLLLVSLPLLAYLLLGSRAESILPQVRDWMNDNSWLINIAVYLFFIYLFLK